MNQNSIEFNQKVNKEFNNNKEIKNKIRNSLRMRLNTNNSKINNYQKKIQGSNQQYKNKINCWTIQLIKFKN